MSVELAAPFTNFRSSGVTTDISSTGCYVQMLFTAPVGTALDIVVWIGERKLTTKAIVRTQDRGVGNGVEFTTLSAEDRQYLQAWIDAQPEPDADEPQIIR